MRTLSLILVFVFSFVLQGNKPFYETKSPVDTCDCGSNESITIEDVLALGPEGYDQWVEKWGPADGTYYQANVAYSDGTQGRLFRGGNSGRYFVEDSSGSNYYYVSLRAAVRALYLYKKYGCLSSKYRL